MPRLRLLAPVGPHFLVLLLAVLGGARGQGSFEDADKANEYTDQQFDLRHTIPGEPGVDYPILSEVPKTSFVCRGRHEGYYADVESRCQAFRICAHTARSAQGFGFLCPNGTVFSQQKFVCDWYRNVDCDQSERYYDMNRESSVGSTQEMMERVRQMMEYPTKTISQALQEQEHTQGQTQTQAQRDHQAHAHQTLSKDLSNVSGVLSQPGAVSNGNLVVRGEDIKSEALPAPATAATVVDGDGEDIYVNSLGELSSDPGIEFDHTNAHIIAEYPREYHYQKQKNFAERVNAGLELLSDNSAASNEQMAPDYIKQIRNTKEEATQLDLVSNINNLLEEVSIDLDPSVSGYQSMSPQKVKQPFRFLSRGFAMQTNEKDGGKGASSYVYNKPKQTPGTVRFTPNELPFEAAKDTEHKLKFNNDKTTSSSTTTTTTTSTTTEAPIADAIEELFIAPTLPPAFAEEDTTTTATFGSTIEPAPLGYGSELPVIESIGQAAALTASLTLSEDLQQEQAPLSAAAADKTDVDLRAEKLLLAGVKLTSHAEETALRTNKLTLGRPATSTTTTTMKPTTTPGMSTSTETVTEISSTQERIRSYRRFVQKRVGGSGSALRRQLPPGRSTTPRTTKATSTPRSTTPTRSYSERLAASRLRLSRLSLATKPTTAKITTAATTSSSSSSTAATTTSSTTSTTSTTESPLSYVRAGADQGPNKKISVRDIERETGQQRASWDSVQSNLQRFQVQRGNRVYTPVTRATSSPTTPTSSISRASTTSLTSRPTVAASVQQRGRNRHATYRTQAPQQRTRGTTTPRSTTSTQRTTVAALSTLSQQISALAAGYSYAPPLIHNNAPTTAQTVIVSGTQPQAQPQAQTQPPTQQQLQLTQITSSLNPSSAFLPFDKLTRAIVDDSILQNFKSNHAYRGAANGYSSNTQQQQQQRVTKPTTSHSYHYPKPTATAATATAAPALASLRIPQRTQQQQLPQLVLPTQPGIVIARAEGQRIAPSSANTIISSLVNQPQTKTPQSNSYVALNDFINNKFGSSSNTAGPTTIQQQQQQHSLVPQQQPQQSHQLQLLQQQQHQRPPQQQQQQLEQHQQQQHKQQQHQRQPLKQQQQQLSYITQRYQQPAQQHYHSQYQQQPYQQTQQLQHFQQQQQQSDRPSIQSIQQPYLTPNIFVPYQQQQQHLPLFPPLAAAAAPSLAQTTRVANGPGQQLDHLNVPLPALANGLIPAPTLQVAQKRSDVKVGQLQLSSSSKIMDQGQEMSFYAGRTSYEVPQSSVGRLPNDITQQRRLRQRRY
nr:mucin-5AC [Drosophila virilis]